MRPLSRLYWTSFLAAQMWGQARYPFRPLARIEADRDRAARRMAAFAAR
jgi:hypothetical protein